MLVIVQPDPAVRWQKRRFRAYWRSISTPGPGTPPISEEIQALIIRMATENRWRACRIHGAACGDFLREATEECDDGNTESADGCSATCEIEQAFWLRGTADGGGMVSLTVSGSGVSVPTGAGQSAPLVSSAQYALGFSWLTGTARGAAVDLLHPGEYALVPQRGVSARTPGGRGALNLVSPSAALNIDFSPLERFWPSHLTMSSLRLRIAPEPTGVPTLVAGMTLLLLLMRRVRHRRTP